MANNQFPFKPYTRSPEEVGVFLDQVSRRFASDSVVTTVIAAYTVSPELQWTLASTTAGAFAVTIPHASSFPYRKIGVAKIDSSVNAVAVTRSGTDTISGATVSSLSTQWQTCFLVSDGITTWVNF